MIENKEKNIEQKKKTIFYISMACYVFIFSANLANTA